VRAALEQGKALSELSADELAAHSPQLAAHKQEVEAALAQSSWLESKVSEGGTSLARVREQLAGARAVLDQGITGRASG
jgi:argininosuccinate lyase